VGESLVSTRRCRAQHNPLPTKQQQRYRIPVNRVHEPRIKLGKPRQRSYDLVSPICTLNPAQSVLRNRTPMTYNDDIRYRIFLLLHCCGLGAARAPPPGRRGRGRGALPSAAAPRPHTKLLCCGCCRAVRGVCGILVCVYVCVECAVGGGWGGRGPHSAHTYVYAICDTRCGGGGNDTETYAPLDAQKSIIWDPIEYSRSAC
jgi:hypothetical protein